MYRLSVLLGFAFFLSGGGVHAAPQILGLVATGPQPTTLYCRDGVCSARFTTFCLQQSHDAPAPGTPYQPVDSRSLQLVVTDGDGRTATVAAPEVAIRSVNNYTSVLISVPEEALRALGAVSAALAVAPRATLLPAAAAQSPSSAEVARASGEYRAVGEVHVDRGGVAAETAGVLMTMINALHAHAPAAEPRDVPRDVALVRDILATTGAAGADRVALRERIDLCAGLAAGAWYRGGMPTCLESYHDGYVSTLTGHYWNAVGTGF